MKKILILGASYGSLLGAKLALAGHAVTLVCLPAEVEAFNRDGARVRLPIKGREGLVEIDTRKAPGKLDAAGPAAVDPKHYDLSLSRCRSRSTVPPVCANCSTRSRSRACPACRS